MPSFEVERKYWVADPALLSFLFLIVSRNFRQAFISSFKRFIWAAMRVVIVDQGAAGSSSYRRIVLVAVLQTWTLLFWEETSLLNVFRGCEHLQPNSHSPQFYQGRAELNHDQIPLEVSEKTFFVMSLDWNLFKLLFEPGWWKWLTSCGRVISIVAIKNLFSFWGKR